MLLDRLLDLLEEKKLMMPEDRAYTLNLFLDALKLDDALAIVDDFVASKLG